MTLKEKRLAKGLTQMDMAVAIGVSLNTYRMWEYGMPPTEENRSKLDNLLGGGDSGCDCNMTDK